MIAAERHQKTINRRTCFGRTDYYRFDDEKNPLSDKNTHVGTGKIGKVRIECISHWTKAQWGVLGPNKFPAGIVYIDLSILQPTGYKLRSATVTITLSCPVSEKHLGGKRWKRHHEQPATKFEVQMTDKYGPRFITGQPSIKSYETERSAMPSIDVGGFAGVGGVGWKKTESGTKTDCWKFYGSPKASSDGGGFTALVWHLEETKLDNQPPHPPRFHTAFAFHHSKKPTRMHVEVEGKLKNRMNLSRFLSKPMITDVDLTLVSSYTKRLDNIAEYLNYNMELENSKEAPAEMTGTLPVIFKEEPSSPVSSDDLEGSTIFPAGSQYIEAQEPEFEDLMALLQQPARVRSRIGASKTRITSNGYREPYQQKDAIDRDTPAPFQNSEEETKAALGVSNSVALALMQFLIILLNSMGLDLKK
ncbi:hypothetical protein CCHR01_10702 [Colletotrichum chrysophilum]|uniref:Uncharacterized protein n=1 Tax=Colletotrichum chrysophilum TaxID=1836956 RepID=A0AAD9AJH6_9PEZI|nr:hypothetical protein CCHR01_10702 [Colletotrichum chrysophilum]